MFNPISLQCPKCDGLLTFEGREGKLFSCSFCGTKLLFQNGGLIIATLENYKAGLETRIAALEGETYQQEERHKRGSGCWRAFRITALVMFNNRCFLILIGFLVILYLTSQNTGASFSGIPLTTYVSEAGLWGCNTKVLLSTI